MSSHSQGQVFIEPLGQLFQDVAPHHLEQLTMLAVLWLSVRLSLPWTSHPCLGCPQRAPSLLPSSPCFHSAAAGPKSCIVWNPEGLSRGKVRRLWVLQSGAHGAAHGFRTSMVALPLRPPQSQDSVSLCLPVACPPSKGNSSVTVEQRCQP